MEFHFNDENHIFDVLTVSETLIETLLHVAVIAMLSRQVLRARGDAGRVMSRTSQ